MCDCIIYPLSLVYAAINSVYTLGKVFPKHQRSGPRLSAYPLSILLCLDIVPNYIYPDAAERFVLLTHKRIRAHTYSAIPIPFSTANSAASRIPSFAFTCRGNPARYIRRRARSTITREVVPPSRRLSLYLEIDAALSYS